MSEKSFTVSICDLAVQVSKCMEAIQPGRGFPENLVTEWTEFFSDSIFDAILPLYVEICGELSSKYWAFFAMIRSFFLLLFYFVLFFLGGGEGRGGGRGVIKHWLCLLECLECHKMFF